MSEMRRVTAICNGTVIDHIPSGRAVLIFSTRNIVADVLKIEDLELSQEELDRLALISPQASVAIIRNYGVAEKRVVELNEELVNVARCTFWNCITQNKMEPLPQKLRVVSHDPIEVRCYYCGRGQNMEEIIENIL